MSYRVKMTRVVNGSALRTNEVEGTTDSMPEVGETFIVFGKPLTEGAVLRVVETSPVREIVGSFGPVDGTPYTILFETENSTYRIDILE